MRLAVTYDISDDRSRRQVFKTLKRYGAWRQYSVFELEVDKTQRVELEDELSTYLNPDDGDHIRLYRICAACQEATSDLGDEPPDEQSHVI